MLIALSGLLLCASSNLNISVCALWGLCGGHFVGEPSISSVCLAGGMSLCVGCKRLAANILLALHGRLLCSRLSRFCAASGDLRVCIVRVSLRLRYGGCIRFLGFTV